MAATGHPKESIAKRIQFEAGNKGNKLAASRLVDAVIAKEQEKKARDTRQSQINSGRRRK